MRSGTVLAVVVAFVLGIGCTISAIAWFLVASANVSLQYEVDQLAVQLADEQRANQNTSSQLAKAEAEIAGLQAVRTTEAREARIQSDTLKGEIQSLNERLQSALKGTQVAVDNAVAAERRSLDRKDQQIAELKGDLDGLRIQIREILATEGVGDAMESARARQARDSRLTAEKERLIPFRIYARTVTSESPAGKRYTETEQLVAFDTNRDGKFGRGDEIWMQGRKAYSYEAGRLSGFELKREGECLPEGMAEIGN